MGASWSPDEPRISSRAALRGMPEDCHFHGRVGLLSGLALVGKKKTFCYRTHEFYGYPGFRIRY